VNLFLDVGGRRDDGFHEIDTLFQAVSLWDLVYVRSASAGVALAVHGPDLGPPEENLAVRAAHVFLSETGASGGVRLELSKGIPAGAGLGGGSSDAAAVLRGMNALWGGPIEPARLKELGASLGSDVAFFLGGSVLARGTGRGDVLLPLPALPPADLVVVLPPVHVATGDAYAALDRSGPAAPASGRGALSLAAGWADVRAMARNDFEAVVAGRHPEVRRSLGALRVAGGRPTLLSGSGSACFGLFDGEASAREVAGRLQAELGWPARAVRTLSGLPEPEWSERPGVEGFPPLG
jgi:4-diphosphocytidyl-2-C-methyl-D-erythritol kinase